MILLNEKQIRISFVQFLFLTKKLDELCSLSFYVCVWFIDCSKKKQTDQEIKFCFSFIFLISRFFNDVSQLINLSSFVY